MPTFCRRLGWLCVGMSLALLLWTVYCYAWQPDRFAAFTVMPMWLWGVSGMALAAAAGYFLRARWAWTVTALWMATLLVGADEARVIANWGTPAPQPGAALPVGELPVVRVATLNCALLTFGNPAADIARWQPDIVLLQEVFPHQARQIATALYGENGDVRTHQTNAVVTRGKIVREANNPLQRDQQVTVVLPSGLELEVVNVHLATAATDLRLWRRAAWSTHRRNRLKRQNELGVTLQILGQTTYFPESPAILGGDFNAPAPDILHRQLARHFVDAFAAAGTGWGDTFHRRFPILRIDHLYATRDFTPVRSRVVMTRHSDHRMVIADLVVRP